MLKPFTYKYGLVSTVLGFGTVVSTGWASHNNVLGYV